ncbi:unnamed protein product [Rotaria socialis]|uniref:PAS domain-containing protein n=1 Tax=Rotaria socialis TaxID=392032 RepID=A0A821KFJ2_9BILA|nr:unnamed protein product [Rotaria socialis]CAF4733233.1 unnamed protein product [Rotaria socialis]
MSRQRTQKGSTLTANGVAHSTTEFNSTPHKRRRQTSQALEALSQLVKDPSNNGGENKLNKNDILSLTLARLLRQKYWPSNNSNKNVELLSGIETSTMADDLNGFFVVLNTSGRIVLMSDNIEYHLRKNVRSLCPQLTSIYNCVSKEDHESIRQMLSTPTNAEQRIICTWHLPRGKRPSRNHTEKKSMLMTGHFFSINNEENTNQYEQLFIARCEQILSSTPSIPTNSIGSTSTTTLRFVLSEQLNIREISSNTESLLGYKAEELMDQPISRFLATEHIQILEQARQSCILGQHYTVMNVLDLYTRDGDRLTFVCNTHMLIEGRRRPMKLGFLAQLIDPSANYDFFVYANKQNLERLKTTNQSEFTYSSTMDLNTVTPTNILLAKDEACLNLNDIPTVCPTTILPQRRKRRRVNQVTVKIEPSYTGDTIQQSPQIANDLYESHASSSESLASTASPTQEIGYTDEFYPYINDIDESEKIKWIHGFPSINDINDVLGLNNDPQCYSLITPTMSSIGFFC